MHAYFLSSPYFCTFIFYQFQLSFLSLSAPTSMYKNEQKYGSAYYALYDNVQSVNSRACAVYHLVTITKKENWIKLDADASDDKKDFPFLSK